LVNVPLIIKMIISSRFSLKFDLSFEDTIIMNNAFSKETYESMFKDTSKLCGSIFDVNNIKKYGNSLYVPKKFSDDDMLNTHSLDSSNGQNTERLIKTRSILSKTIHQRFINIRKNNSFYGIINNIYSIILMIFILTILFLIYCFYYIFSSDNTLTKYTMNDNMHAYGCPNQSSKLIILSYEFFLLLYIIIIFINVKDAKYIYNDIKVIGIISAIWIIFDPLLNVSLPLNLIHNNIYCHKNILTFLHYIYVLYIFIY